VLLFKAENRRYATGFTGSAGLALITAREALLAVDFRYYEQATLQALTCEVLRAGLDLPGAIADAARAREVRRVGFEADHVPYAEVELWRTKFDSIELVPIGDVGRLRMVKDEAEIAAIQRAAEIADAAFAHMLTVLRPGITERHGGLELEIFLRRAGAERQSFEPVMVSGPRSALPHGRATDRVLGPGDFVTLDYGPVVDGYTADFTRTVVVGSPDDRHREIYAIVLEAEQRAVAAVRAGLSSRAVDAVARDVVTAAGYGNKCGPNIGHGIGLETHEAPFMSRTDVTLEPGMVVTIEPGIYIPGWGGVRIEDDVVVTADGARVVTHAPRELISVPT
jgi:Xaa-Pro aminopeptidase